MRMTIDDIAFHRVGSLNAVQIAHSIKSGLALACPADTPAVDALAIAAINRIPLVLVTANPQRPPHRNSIFESISLPQQSGYVVCGLVEPGRLRTALNTHFRKAPEPLLDILMDFEKDKDQAKRRWRHEWLNLEVPVLQYCPEDGGHLTTLPCLYHSSPTQAIW
jgi:hypothetical protein